MYMTGYGAETMGRGGVNLAISDRSLALNFNPAGISQLQGKHFTVNLSLLAPSLKYQNTINDSLNGEDAYYPLPAFAYVQGKKDSPWTWGGGFVAQGGMGAEFAHANTFFGTVDETFTEIRFMTVNPTVAYSISDDMAIGAALNIGYADASFRLFPNTSFFNQQNPQMSFFGVNMKKAGGLQTNARVGWWWRAHPNFSVGAIYQTETKSNYEDGEMWVNFTNHPMVGQRVKYSADMEGFTFAAQAGVGFSAKVADKWVLAMDVKRYFWDDAIDSIVVTATNPELAGAPPEVVLPPFVFDWKDQWIFALGGDYRATDLLTLRAGLNYGENPVPSGTLTPLFPATIERHISAGFSYLFGNKLIEIVIERAFNQDQINNTMDPMVNPFGPASRVDHEQWTASFGVSWALDSRRSKRADPN
jgi:long-chain fatty acid transport protein